MLLQLSSSEKLIHRDSQRLKRQKIRSYKVFSLSWNIYIIRLSPRLRGHHQKGSRKNVRARSHEGMPQTALSGPQHSSTKLLFIHKNKIERERLFLNNLQYEIM